MYERERQIESEGKSRTTVTYVWVVLHRVGGEDGGGDECGGKHE